jgi:hypothetical protein
MLKKVIPPQIFNDPFYFNIVNLIQNDSSLQYFLDIGASSGEGSTKAIIEGVQQRDCTIFALEFSIPRYNILQENYINDKRVKPYNYASISINDYPTFDKIIEFYNSTKTNLNLHSINEVKKWYDEDILYMKENVNHNIIDIIKQSYNINIFDFVIIDGGEFVAEKELEKIYGSKYILLDDINAYKNYNNHYTLKNSKDYSLLYEEWNIRNGYSIFINNNLI